MTGFGAAVERICSSNGLTQKDIAAGIGVAPETVTRWKWSFSPPSDDLFRALAYLRRFEPGLAAEDLVGPSEVPSPSSPEAA
jgi:transcriptional regulator with XRE-family HTH domain